MKHLLIILSILLLSSFLTSCEKKGQRTETYNDGDKYVGEWKNGKKHGQGTQTFPDGSKYVGEWKDGLLHGQGTLTFPDGGKYVGEFKDGKRWKGTEYDKYGNIVVKFVDGLRQY